MQTAREFVRANYYAGNMDPDELIGGLMALVNEPTRETIRRMYYSEDAELEDVVAIVL